MALIALVCGTGAFIPLAHIGGTLDTSSYSASHPFMQQGRGRVAGREGGRGRGRGRGGARAVRYIPEREMDAFVRDAALTLEFDEGQANMLGACGKNIYAMGCGYHPTTVTILEEICSANKVEPWATVSCLSRTRYDHHAPADHHSSS